MDAIALLKADHRAVEDLFVKFEKAGDRALKTKRRLVDGMIKELAIHAGIEEQVLYPAVRAGIPALEDDMLEALEEHHIVKWTLSELADLDPEAERFDAKVAVLIESVRHHVKEEERDIFPKMRKAFSRKELEDLGSALDNAKKLAPTRAHPRSPDVPPGNLIAGTAAGLVDRARDGAAAVVEGLRP